jgi:hypothetical protein
MEAQMIIEQRTYRVKPGKIPEYLAAVETLGLPLMRSILGGLIGYFTTEFGPVTEVVHLWAYEDLDDRARRRAEIAAHPDWPKFLATVRPLLEHQASRVLKPASFNRLTLEQVRALNR